MPYLKRKCLIVYIITNKKESEMNNMTRKLKLVSIIMVLVFLAVGFAMPAKAAYIGENGFNYQLNGDDNTAILALYDGVEADIVIPSNYYKFTVTSIANNLFSGNKKITSVVVPNTVVSMGDYVFFKATSLKSVTLSDSLSKINTAVFYGCTSLEKVVIPASVTTIDSSAFLECPNLTIYGYEGTYAQTFAEENGIPFSVMEVPVTYNLIGDIDGDEDINSYDALMILRISVGLNTIEPEYVVYADTDGDGTITSNDSLVALRYSVGFEENNPYVGKRPIA